jgi:formiminoglutamase
VNGFAPCPAPVPDTAAGDPRVGHLIGTRLAPGATPRVVIAGFPVDDGVRRNGGRAGAAEGPGAIRRHLVRLTPDVFDPEPFIELVGATQDAGDLVPSGDLERDQARLGDAVGEWLGAGAFVILLGGGHETAYGHFLGYVAARQSVAILNWDAHADVRELRDGLGHSGSPFRQALEHPSGRCTRYSVAGLQPQSAAASHLDLVRARGSVFSGTDLSADRVAEPFARLTAPAYVSFDLDAIDQAFAPGVSAPAARGLSPDVWLRAAHLAGRTPGVTSADVVELCPRLDRDEQTARLAALTVWEILRGLAARR